MKPGTQVRVKGVEVDVRNPEGRTPLMIAASKGNADIVRALIYCSASVNYREKDGYV